MKHSAKVFARNTGLVVISVALTLAAVEIFFRYREPALESSRESFSGIEPAPASSSEFSVLGIGESSMVGEPYPVSFADLIALELRHDHPGLRTETRLVARQGATLKSLSQSALQAIKYHPSAVVLLAGHNDFLGAIGHHEGCASGSDPVYDLLHDSALFRFVNARLLRRGIGTKPDFRERTLFDEPIACRPQWDDILEEYGALVAAVARACRDAGVPAVLVFPAGNETELNPNRSVFTGSLESRAAFEEAYRSGRTAMLRGDLADAAGRFARAAALDGTFAQLDFDQGRLSLAMGDRESARAHFSDAREHDGFPWRALEAQRLLLERAASRYGVGFVDGRRVVADASPSGLLDAAVFHDIHHPSLTGYLALARAVAASLASQPSAKLPPAASQGSLTETDVLDGIGFTPRDAFRLFQSRVRWFEGFADLTFDPTTRVLAVLDNVAAMRALDPVLTDAVLRPNLEADMRKRLAASLRPYGGTDPEGELAHRRPFAKLYPYLTRPDPKPVHMGDLPSFVRLGEGEIADDKGPGGGPLVANGRAERGFCAIPPSDVAFRLNGRYSRLSLTLTTAEGAAAEASLNCSALGDGRVLFEASRTKPADFPKNLELDLRGVQELHLFCTADGSGSAAVAWVSPRLELVQ